MPSAKSFQISGRVYWIGYCGPLSNYPVHSCQNLKEFYTQTLTSVPTSFLNSTLYRFKFNVDASLIGNDGKYLNHRLANFISEQATIFAAYDINPEREVSIVLKRGANFETSSLTYSEADGWVAHVGLKSGCSPGLLSYFEQTIRRQDELNTKRRETQPKPE
jgi:hypothetical protein